MRYVLNRTPDLGLRAHPKLSTAGVDERTPAQSQGPERGKQGNVIVAGAVKVTRITCLMVH